MDSVKCYEKYPSSFVIGSSSLQFLIYAIGAYLVFRLEPIAIVFYLIYIVILEIRLLKNSCIHCYYYGKRCAFGKGSISALFFKRGISKKFIEKKISLKDLIPDFLVSIIPLIIGVYLLIKEFDWIVLMLIVSLVILGFPVIGYLRGALACKNCKQREIGCPAEQAFKKK